MNASNSPHLLGRFRSWCARNLTVPMVFTLVFAAATVWSLWDGVRSEGARPSVAATPVSATVSNDTGHLTSQPLPSARVTGKFLTCPIRDLPVATWILAENPETEGNLGFDYSLFDPAELCVLKLRLPKPDGSVLHIDKIDFTEWLEEERLTVGSTTYLDYEELGISGDAEILAIAPCPRIPPRPSPRHCLVTSKFAHEAANVLDLYIEGLNEPIGVTANHPIWSEDRREFVPAGELIQGERALQADYSTRHVLRATPRPGHVPVFNLEVNGEHVYFVSPAGVLVHNACPKGTVLANKAAGDAVRDAIAAREAPALIEQNLRVAEGLRRVDVLKQGSRIVAIESKVGRTSLTPRVRQELARDVKLLRSGQVDEVVWEFTRSGTTGKIGPTKELLDKLRKFGITVITR